MNFTSEIIEVLDYTDFLTSQIAKSTISKAYHESKRNLEADVEAQKLISEFVDWKEKYEEVQRFGKYHPNFKEYSKKMREVKRTLDLNESVAQFKKAEKELQVLLNEISKIIGQAVSPFIKVPSSNPFFDSMSHGSGCGGGGSCSCSTKKAKQKKAIS